MKKQENPEHVFAYYLPQFHQIDENDEWWGEGYTEWTALQAWEPLYDGHRIIHPSPALGYYSLDDVTVIEKQYTFAKENGIDTFAFWYYWFDEGERLLEKPLDALLKSNVNVQFCLSWANHSWYNKTKGLLLKEQKYDFLVRSFASDLLKYCRDERYKKIDGRPVFVIYKPQDVPNLKDFLEQLNKAALEAGFPEFFYIFENTYESDDHSIHANAVLNSVKFLNGISFFKKIQYKVLNYFKAPIIRKYDYNNVVGSLNEHCRGQKKSIPVVFPNWDTTPRHNRRGVVLEGSNPNSFLTHCQEVKEALRNSKSSCPMVFVKSWNEWAEGNAIEPSKEYGDEYLKVFKKIFIE